MVSTRGPKFKFVVGERVLCYEPDPSKAKVLYDSKVIEIVEEKDKKGRRTVEYLIHFQGWNSSWDRAVQEDFVLKDTDKNRQLQRDLAERSQLQIGAYLYRKERKKRKSSNTNVVDAKIPFRPSSDDLDDGSSCCSTTCTAGSVVHEEIMENMPNIQAIETHEESCSSSAESIIEEDRVALHISDNLKRFLDFDHQMITKHNKLVNLPAKIPVITILENFVKYYSIKSICGPINTIEAPRRRNSSAKSEKREKDYDKLKTSINLRKEVADGLRIYFDFVLKDYLLYKEELEQASILLSSKYLENFTYTASEKTVCTLASETLDGQTNDSNSEEHSTKRRLRSHKNTEGNEIILDLGAATNHSEEVDRTDSVMTQMSSLSLLRQLLPTNMAVPLKTRELLQDILAWQILPSDSPTEASMIFGSVHLSRLLVKLPDFVNATPMADDKLKLLLQYLDNFIEFLETHREWFTEHQYNDAPINYKDAMDSNIN